MSEIPAGITFRYRDMAIEANEYGAASKSIEPLVASGRLKKISKGLFYKPQQTIFRSVLPREDELLKPYLFKNGRRIAYISGTGLYNKMGLTTQMSFIVTLATKSRRATIIEIGNVKIKPVRSYADVTNDNYNLLGILDAFKDFSPLSKYKIGITTTFLPNAQKWNLR